MDNPHKETADRMYHAALELLKTDTRRNNLGDFDSMTVNFLRKATVHDAWQTAVLLEAERDRYLREVLL